MEKLKRKIKNKSIRICVVGLGYVGLPTAVFFASYGFRVIGADLDEYKVKLINKKISPLSELYLDKKLEDAVKNKMLKATTNVTSAVANSDVILIVVPTPVTEAKEPDVSYVESASEEVAKGLKKGQLVILESTVYPGATEEIVKPKLEKTGLKAGIDFGLAYCPERYNPGDRAHTLDKVARIVGGITPEWGEVARILYSTIIKEPVIHVKDIKTAEAAKVIENIQRDINIALINELALIFERMDIDIIDVINAAATKWNFIKFYPGAGVGGHCLPHDPYYLTKKAKEVGYHPQIILAGRRVNDSMPHHVYELLQDSLNEIKKPIKESKIVILGASYKKNTGDMRSAPTEALVKELKEKGANITIVDSFVKENNLFGYRVYKKANTKIISDVDAIILMTAHDEFENLDMQNLRKQIKNKNVVFIDGRRVFDPKKIKEFFIYRGIGAGGWNK